jgi:hypothetical protein
MSCPGVHFLFVVLCGGMLADEIPEAALRRPEVPRILQVMPPGVVAGASQRIQVRGDFLARVNSAGVTGLATPPPVRLLSSGNATAIPGQTLTRTASDLLEVELKLPEDAPAGTNLSLVVTSPDGAVGKFPLWVVAPGRLVEELEPNDSFEAAPAFRENRILRGSLDPASDVDALRVDLKAGQTLRAEVWASRLGGPLHAMLGLQDRRGVLLMMNDGSEPTGFDPVLEFHTASDATVLLAVSGISGAGDASAAYLMEVQVTP